MKPEIHLFRTPTTWGWYVEDTEVTNHEERFLEYGSAADYADACKDALVAYDQVMAEENK